MCLILGKCLRNNNDDDDNNYNNYFWYVDDECSFRPTFTQDTQPTGLYVRDDFLANVISSSGSLMSSAVRLSSVCL